MARSFNGTTDFITTSFLATTTPVSIHCWIYLLGAGLNQSMYGVKNDVVNGGLQFRVSNTNNLQLLVSNVAVLVSGGTALTNNPGPWYATAGSYDGTTAKVFLNGIQDGSAAASNSLAAAGDTLAYIGCASAGGGAASQFIHGSMADLAIWSAVLSPVEIASLAAGVRPSSVRPGSLVAWWPLDGYQAPAIDLSRGKSLGTLSGSILAIGPPQFSAAPIFPGIAMPQSFKTPPPPPVFVLMPQIVT